MARIVLFGNGQVASVAYFYLTHDSPHEVVAFTVDGAYVKEDTMHGLPVVPFEEVQQRYSPDDFEMLVSVSYQRVNHLRAEKYAAARAKGYRLTTYVSPKAVTWPGLEIGDNCFIFENNVIQPFVQIGSNVILWSGNHIGHHTTIEDHCFLASHVVVSGAVTIGHHSFVGVNATIRDGITVAPECVIGAGALILRSTEERGVYIGQPAEKYRRTSDQLPRI